MKKHLLLSLISVTLLFEACTLDRYPLTGPSTGTFPASEEEALAGLLAAYKNLANNVQLYEPFPNRWMDQLSDIGCTRTVLSHWPDYTMSTITSNTSQVKQSYARIYKTVGRVHMVLDNLDNLKSKLDEQTYNQFKIELLMLRAYVYDQAVSKLVHANYHTVSRHISREVATESNLVFIHVNFFSHIIFSNL